MVGILMRNALSAAGVCLVLGGCAIKYDMAGKFENANEVFRGTVLHNLLIGRAEIVATGENSGVTCRGHTYVTYVPPLSFGCAGQRGKAEMLCEDGRRIDADWHAASCTSGSGRGADEYGNRFNFVFGLDSKEAEAFVAAALPTVADKPRVRGPATDGAGDASAKPAPQPGDFDRKTARQGLPDFPIVPVDANYRPTKEHPDDIAVILANANYQARGKDIPDVVPAYADAEGFKQFVVRGMGVKAENVVFVKDATAAEMTYVFGTRRNFKGKLYEWVKPGKSRVFVYYAGHGAPGDKTGRSFLVPVDADGSLISLKGYPLEVLYQNLSKLPAKSVTLVLETSFSGISENGDVLNKILPGLKSKDTPVPSNITVATAGAANQIASWERNDSQSLFTSYFLKGMSGEADNAPHGNGDGRVEWSEIDAYLKATLTRFARQYYGRRQIARIVPAGAG